MFHELVNDNPFIEFAEELGVRGDPSHDGSFKSTFTALFNPRGQMFVFSRSNIAPNEDEAILYYIKPGKHVDYLTDIELTELQDVNAFLKQKDVNAKVKINAEKKVAVVEIEYSSTQVAHLIQALTTRLFPEVFKDNPLTELETKLIRSLSKTDGYIMYSETILEMAKAYDFRELKINRELEGFEINFEKARLDSLESSIRGKQNEIDRYIEMIGIMRADVRKLMMDKMGIELMASKEDTNGLRDLFIAEKNLELKMVDGGNVYYYVNNYMNSWDDAVVDLYVDNERSSFYEYQGSGIRNRSDRKKLLKAIFEDRIVRIRIKTGFVLKTRDQIIITSWNSYPDMPNRMPNPHIHHYECLGDNDVAFHDFFGSGNYAGAILQSMHSSGQVTLSDTAVMERFLPFLFGDTDVRFIELPDGTCVTPKGAVNWLNEMEKEGSDE